MTTFPGRPRPSEPGHAQYPVAVYGQRATYENLLLRVKEKLESLRDDIATGYDYKFEYVYTGHNPANLQLNAVTIEIEEVNESDKLGFLPTNQTVISNYNIIISIRVHTGYIDDENNETVNSYLLDLIDDYLSQRHDLGADYRMLNIYAIDSYEAFDESDSVGGQLMVSTGLMVGHEQQ